MAKFTKPAPLSAAAQRLAEAVKAKAEATAEMEKHQAVIARLEKQVRAVAHAENALARIDAEQAAKMSAWASDETAGDPPQADWEARERLERELSAARATAASAQSAMATPRAALQAASQRASAAHRAAWIASKLIAVEEAESTLGPLKSAIAQIYEARRRVEAAREDVLRELNHADGDVGEVYAALSQFDARRKEAEAVPLAEVLPPDGLVPDGAHELAPAMTDARRGYFT
jgi:chromosome segregation ATPase